MNQNSSTLFHRVLVPPKTETSLHPTMIYLHGRGADEEDLLGLSGYFDDRLLSISVRAPFRFEFGEGYTWYDILEMGKPGQQMFQSSYEKLSSFIDDALKTYPIDPKRLFLFGFSMGTVMAYAMLLTRPDLFAGIVANSGYLAEDTYLDYRWDAMAGKDLFITHGKQDPVIPVMAAQRARIQFEQANARTRYREYTMGHQISDESLADITAWIKQLLNT